MLAPVDQELLRFVPDFRINLLVPEEITEFEKFRTSLGPVLDVVKASRSKGDMERVIYGNPAFRELENDAVATINVVTANEIRIEEEGGVTDMCYGQCRTR